MNPTKTFFSFFSFSFFSFLFSFLLFIPGCKTDLDVNAPYKEITVVYGLLNQNETFHFIKINKSFLGEANAYDLATNRKLSEYENLNAEVVEWKNGTKTGNRWPLLDSLFTNKEAGSFYYPEQTMYYFVEDSLDVSAQYQLNIYKERDTITAKTELINNIPDFTGGQQFVIPCSFGEATPCVKFASGRGKYQDQSFIWHSVKDGKRYQLEMKIFYTDSMTDGTYSNKNITWTFQPALFSSGLEGGEEMSVSIKGEDFFKEMQRQLTPLTDSKIKRRGFVKFYCTVYVAGDDFNTYLLANEPSTGIVQEKPEFSNIESRENGVGIFSARYSKSSPDKKLTYDTLDELVGGQYTFALKFCRLESNGLFCD